MSEPANAFSLTASFLIFFFFLSADCDCHTKFFSPSVIIVLHAVNLAKTYNNNINR